MGDQVIDMVAAIEVVRLDRAQSTGSIARYVVGVAQGPNHSD